MLVQSHYNYKVVAEARSWIGTRFAHQGRVKATKLHCGGCDCLGLIIGVARELKITSKHYPHLLIEHLDCQTYGKNPDHDILIKTLKDHMFEIVEPSIQPGDLGLFNYNNSPHLAIISDYDKYNLGLIHAYAKARKVVEHRFDHEWQLRLVSGFRFNKMNK